jgi:hypothetical protein
VTERVKKEVPPPAGLQPAGLELWSDITGEYSLRRDELRVLQDACRTVDLIERMEAEIAASPLVVSGSREQDIAHPLTTEVRQQRGLFLRQMIALHLPEPEESAGSGVQARSAHGRALAQQRWRRGA